MLASTESPAARFQPYIEELRDFLASRQLACGTPASLPSFLELLRDPTFREEMVSMVRSILYREETLPRTELTEVIAVAVGGTEVLHDSQETRRSMRDIFAFVQEVTHSSRGFTLAESGSADGGSSDWPAPVSAAERATPATMPDSASLVDPSPFTPTNGHLSRSLVHLEEVSQGARDEVAAAESYEQHSPTLTAPDRLNPPKPRRTLAAVLRHSYWIPGMVMLLIAMAAVNLLKRHPAAVRQTVSAPKPSLSLSSGLSKPSAYGAKLSTPRPPYPVLLPQKTANVTPSIASQIQAPSFHGSSVTRPALPAQEASPLVRSASRRPSVLPRPGISNPLGPQEGVFLASSGSMASHLLSAPAPGYPRLASFTHTEGQVIVQVVVGRDGKVSATRVLDGPHLLRSAAEHAIHKWRYRPYLVDGHPTDVATIVTVSFRFR